MAGKAVPAVGGQGARVGGTWKVSVYSSQFYCEPTTTLKNKAFR